MEFVDWMLKDIKAVWDNRYALIIIGSILILLILVSPYLPGGSSKEACDLNSTVCRSAYGMR